MKKNTGAGALERENGRAGNDGKREKASLARFKFFFFPASARFSIKRAVKAPLQEASAGEREAVSLFEKGNYLVVDN